MTTEHHYDVTAAYREVQVNLGTDCVWFLFKIKRYSGDIWNYKLFQTPDTGRRICKARGRVVGDLESAVREAGRILAKDYEPGSAERCLCDRLANGYEFD